LVLIIIVILLLLLLDANFSQVFLPLLFLLHQDSTEDYLILGRNRLFISIILMVMVFKYFVHSLLILEAFVLISIFFVYSLLALIHSFLVIRDLVSIFFIHYLLALVQ
jgi:hypothetical protein